MAKTSILVGDRVYSINSDNDESQLTRIAFTLNEKLNSLKNDGMTDVDLFALAALNMTDDYLRMYDKVKQLEQQIKALKNVIPPITASEAELNKLQENLIYLRDDNNNLRSRNTTLNMENAELKQENEILRKQTKEFSEMIDDTEATLG